MVEIKLFDSELKLMELIWAQEPITAKQLSIIAADSIGWNKNTTYTVLKKLIEKNAVLRTNPNFICTSLVKKHDVQKFETTTLINKLYDGSKKAFFAAFVNDGAINEDDLKELMEMIKKG